MSKKTAVDKVIEKLGGRPAATRAIGISPQAMQKWVNSGRVPVERVLAVSKLTGIPASELRPDIFEGAA